MRLFVFLGFAFVAAAIGLKPRIGGLGDSPSAEGVVPIFDKPFKIIGGQEMTGFGASQGFRGARRQTPYVVAIYIDESGQASGVSRAFQAPTSDDIRRAQTSRKAKGKKVVRGGFQCTGSIIGPRTVLTAAHCVSDDNNQQMATTVMVTAANRWSDGAPKLWEGIGRVVVHPDYARRANSDNDLCILQFDRDIPFSDDVRPINLASQSFPVRTYGLAMGYGAVDFSQEVTSELLKTVRNPIWNCQGERSAAARRRFCTRGVDENGRRGNTCVGDSGGPFVVENQLVGVLSRGSEDCGRVEVDEAEYADVFKNRAWVQRFIPASQPAAPADPANVFQPGQSDPQPQPFQPQQPPFPPQSDPQAPFEPQPVPPTGGDIPPSGSDVPACTRAPQRGCTVVITSQTIYRLAVTYMPEVRPADAVQQIKRANPGLSESNVQVGQVILIPFAPGRRLAVQQATARKPSRPLRTQRR